MADAGSSGRLTWASGFTAVPNVVVVRADLSVFAQRVYALMRHGARQDRYAYVRQQVFIEQGPMSERKARDAVRELEKAGLVRTLQRGQGRVNRYELLNPEAEQLALDRHVVPVNEGEHRHDVPPGSAPDAGPVRHDVPDPRNADALSSDALSQNPPAPGGGGRPIRPKGRRERDLARYADEVEAWAPHPAELNGLAEPWRAAVEQLRRTVDDGAWNLQLADVHPHVLLDGTLVLGAQRSAWIRERFRGVLAEAIAEAFGRDLVVDVVPCQLGVPPECLSPDHPQPAVHTTTEGAA